MSLLKTKLLLPHQGQFIQSPTLFPNIRFHFLVCGYGAGKTSSLATFVLKAVKDLQGKKSRDGHNPRILLGGVTLAHLAKTTLMYIIEDLKNSGTPYRHDTKNNTLAIGKVLVVLVSLSAPQDIVGFDCVASFCDEVDDLGGVGGSADTTFEAVKAVNERTRQIIPGYRRPYLCFSTTSQGQAGLYRVLTNFKKSHVGHVVIRGSTRDNWYLDEDYVNNLYKIYNEKERLVYLEGHFIALAQGRVFGDFDWDKNFVNVALDLQVGQDEKVYWAQDFNQGYHRGCVGVLRGNIIYIIKSYEFADIRQAPKVVRNDFPRNKIVWIPDTTAKDEIRTFTRELHRYSIWWATRSKNPNVEDTAFLCNKLFYTSRLIFTEAAKDHASDCSIAYRDKHGQIPAGKGPLSPIHRCDGVRMLCFFVCVTEKAMFDIKRATVQRHLEHSAETPTIEELPDGYAILNPEALS